MSLDGDYLASPAGRFITVYRLVKAEHARAHKVVGIIHRGEWDYFGDAWSVVVPHIPVEELATLVCDTNPIVKRYVLAALREDHDPS